MSLPQFLESTFHILSITSDRGQRLTHHVEDSIRDRVRDDVHWEVYFTIVHLDPLRPAYEQVQDILPESESKLSEGERDAA